MKKLRLLSMVCACTVSLLSLSANAALVNADWVNMDDNLLTVDTVSKLGWLDITETGGLSRQAVLTEMESGGKFFGFRYATSDEVIDLWGQYGVTLTPAIRAINRDYLDPNIEVASQQLGNLYGQEIAFSDFGTLGLIGIDDLSSSANAGWSGAYRQSGDSIYDGPTRSSLELNESKTWVGSYIVTTVVPVPGATVLMASGLLGLFGFLRRRPA